MLLFTAREMVNALIMTYRCSDNRGAVSARSIECRGPPIETKPPAVATSAITSWSPAVLHHPGRRPGGARRRYACNITCALTFSTDAAADICYLASALDYVHVLHCKVYLPYDCTANYLPHDMRCTQCPSRLKKPYSSTTSSVAHEGVCQCCVPTFLFSCQAVWDTNACMTSLSINTCQREHGSARRMMFTIMFA